MDWFDAQDYDIARQVLQRGVAAIYLVAFLSSLNQFRVLAGEHGLLPVGKYVGRRRPGRRTGARRPLGRRLLGVLTDPQRPTFFSIRYSDALLVAFCVTGMILAAAVVIGAPQLGPPWLPLAVFLLMWGLYMSIAHAGGTFYGFGWEMLLLEAGFTVAFLGSDQVPPPTPILLLIAWLVFRLEFGAGMIKLRGGSEWRDLTALTYHHETQPMPGPLSRQAHLLPRPMHKGEVLGNHFAQLIVPFFLFAPQPIASVAAAIVILTQLWLVATGNFSWLNWITIVLAFGRIGDSVIHTVLPFLPSEPEPLEPVTSPMWWVVLVLTASALLVVLSWWPLRNLFARRQLMNASFNRWGLANAYGAFGTVTRRRIEIVIEGTTDADPDDDADWREYEFKGKPGEVKRMPQQWAPYHLRLDWLMWFLPLGTVHEEWFYALLTKLLEADRATLRLLRHVPFGAERPRWVRARSYHYRFSTRAEFRASGDRWVRTPVRVVIPPLSLRADDR